MPERSSEDTKKILNLRNEKKRILFLTLSAGSWSPSVIKAVYILYNNKSEASEGEKPQPKHTKHHNITNSSISWGKRQQYNKNRGEKGKHENKIIHLIISTKALSAFLFCIFSMSVYNNLIPLPTCRRLSRLTLLHSTKKDRICDVEYCEKSWGGRGKVWWGEKCVYNSDCVHRKASHRSER